MFWSPGHMPVPGRPAPESSLACAGVPGRAAAGALLPARASGAHRCPELSSPSPHVWPAPAHTPRACWNRPAVSGEAQGEASGRKPTYLDDAVSFPDAPVLGCDAVRVDLEHTASISAPADTSAGVRTAAPHSHAHPCPRWAHKRTRLSGRPDEASRPLGWAHEATQVAPPHGPPGLLCLPC